jgi:hypothetical protein
VTPIPELLSRNPVGWGSIGVEIIVRGPGAGDNEGNLVSVSKPQESANQTHKLAGSRTKFVVGNAQLCDKTVSLQNINITVCFLDN